MSSWAWQDDIFERFELVHIAGADAASCDDAEAV